MRQQPARACPERAPCWRFHPVQYNAGSIIKMNLINENVLPSSECLKTSSLKRNEIKS